MIETTCAPNVNKNISRFSEIEKKCDFFLINPTQIGILTHCVPVIRAYSYFPAFLVYNVPPILYYQNKEETKITQQ